MTLFRTICGKNCSKKVKNCSKKVKNITETAHEWHIISRMCIKDYKMKIFFTIYSFCMLGLEYGLVILERVCVIHSSP